jgi:hypothetical protein
MAMLAPLAGAACANTPGGETAGKPADAPFRNITTPSESVHSGVCSPDGERRVTVRLCRYPDLGLAWVWMHARTPKGFFSYVDHMAPCSRNATVTEGEAATYTDTRKTLTFERLGAVSKPRACRIQGSAMAWKTQEGRFGPGGRKLGVQIEFAPARLFSGLNAGRTEVFGHSRAVVTVDGDTFEIEGPAQFHEQRQTTARFTVPFSYLTLWGEQASATMLVTPGRRDGYILDGDRTMEIDNVQVGPPDLRRKLSVRLKDGKTLVGEITLVQSYSVPIVGQTWQGHMVRAELGPYAFLGHANDFRPGEAPYSL